MSANKYASDEINERITELLKRRRINTGYISDGRHTFGYYRTCIQRIWRELALMSRSDEGTSIVVSMHESVGRCGNDFTLWGLGRFVVIINGEGVVLPAHMWCNAFEMYRVGANYQDPDYLILP